MVGWTDGQMDEQTEGPTVFALHLISPSGATDLLMIEKMRKIRSRARVLLTLFTLDDCFASTYIVNQRTQAYL